MSKTIKRVVEQEYNKNVKNLENVENVENISDFEELKYLQEIMASVPGSIYWKDKNGVYLGCNDYMLKATGLKSKEDIIGKTDVELWPKRAGVLKYNDDQVIKTGKQIETEESVFLGGKERFFTVVKMPLKNKKGEIIGVIGNSLEVTRLINQKNKFEKKSNVISQYLDGIMATVPGGMYWKDKKGNYLGCNDFLVQVTGMKSKADIIGKTDNELWPEQAESLRRNDKEVMANAMPMEFEEEVIVKGERKYYAVVKIPLKDEHDNVVGIVGNSLDITELKNTQKALEEQIDQTKRAYLSNSQFLSLASHEIRTPVSNGITMLNVIDKYLTALPDDAKRFLNTSKSEMNHVLDSIQYLLKYMELEQTKLDLRRSYWELTSVVEMLQANYANQNTSKNIQWEYEVDEHLPHGIKFTGARLVEALDVIVKNAIKYSPDKGKIKISLYKAPKHFLAVTVKDEGVGILEDHLRALFRPLLLKDKEREKVAFAKPSIRLSYAKKLAEGFGGSIEVKSEEGKGTAVTVFIPYEEDPQEEEDAIFRGTPSNYLTTKTHFNVLVVEDNSLTLELHRVELEHANCTVDAVTTGKKAIEAAKQKQYDIVFMDITLPDISGIQALRAMRVLWKDPVPFIAVTSHATAKEMTLFEQKGFMEVLQKPVSTDQFKACIARLQHCFLGNEGGPSSNAED